jgi:hypothetical protein
MIFPEETRSIDPPTGTRSETVGDFRARHGGRSALRVVGDPVNYLFGHTANSDLLLPGCADLSFSLRALNKYS